MIYTQTLFVRLGISLLALLFGGCNDGHDQQTLAAAPEQQSLVGNWNAPTTYESLEFKQDGSFVGSLVHYGSNDPQNVSGKYLVAGDEIIVNLDNGEVMTWQFHYAGTDLVVVYKLGGQFKRDGTFSKFHRVSEDSDNGPMPTERVPVNDEEAQRRTVEDIRNIGTAMFSWLTDQDEAGVEGEPQVVEFSRFPAITRKELEKVLFPYMKSVPETDGWGHPYEFYFDVKGHLGKHAMGIRSPGRDGRFSAFRYSSGAFAPSDYNEDIVWANFYFVRWPQTR